MCSLEPTFRALQHSRRRVALRAVTAHESLSLADLAELVSERESGDALRDVSAERVRDVYFSLYHTHVPVLRDAGLVWYRQDADRVGVTDETPESLSAARAAIEAVLSA